MNTTPSGKFLQRFLIVWIIAVIFVVLFLFVFISPLSPFHACTLIGCRDTLQLKLAHEPLSQYTILLTSSSGETRSVTCSPGKISATNPTDAMCRTGIVSIYGFSPAEVTVQVTWQGGDYTTTNGHPEYTTFHPNGIFCPPACRLGKLSIELP